jgi:hypothetical protein
MSSTGVLAILTTTADNKSSLTLHWQHWKGLRGVFAQAFF